MTKTEKPPLDDVGHDYARLAFGIERHVPGFIDAYLGPEDVRAAHDAGPAPKPEELVAVAQNLLSLVTNLNADESRKGYLAAQVRAMLATARRLNGEVIPYRDEVRLLFDVEPQATSEAVYDAAIADLDRLLPGDGPVAERMIAWRAGYVVTPEVARQLVDVILPEVRERTRSIVDLPHDEAIEIRMVRDKPWSGYNWYLGGGRSRVELNTDLPIYAFRLTDLLAHEAYPGHHTEHALKERLYTEVGLGEFALQLLNTPECVISEGIATVAEELIYSREEVIQFKCEQVYPVAGISGDPEREIAVGAAQRALRSVPGNAALMLHEDGRSEAEVIAYLRRYSLSTDEEARKRFQFIADPLLRAYIFTYHAGHDLISAWLDAPPAGQRRDRFRRLLTEQISPAQIVTWTEQATAAPA